jgi:FixJ family two-component response regulator
MVLPTGQPMVLLVEDDALIRTNTAEMLSESGMTVVEAASAEDAIMALQTVLIDVLVTDVNLPGLSGPELATKARALRPTIGIVFATGDSEVAMGRNDPGVTVLSKPYDMVALTSAVATVLNMDIEPMTEQDAPSAKAASDD